MEMGYSWLKPTCPVAAIMAQFGTLSMAQLIEYMMIYPGHAL